MSAYIPPLIVDDVFSVCFFISANAPARYAQYCTVPRSGETQFMLRLDSQVGLGAHVILLAVFVVGVGGQK